MQSRTRLKFHLIAPHERLMRALARVRAGLHSQFESFMSYEGRAPVFLHVGAACRGWPPADTLAAGMEMYTSGVIRPRREGTRGCCGGGAGSGLGAKNWCDKGQNEAAQKILVICGDWWRPRLKMGIWVCQWSFLWANLIFAPEPGSIHVDCLNGVMTDNIYCPLCSQILEADSDSSVHLRKQCKWGSGGWGVGLTWLYVDSVNAGECFKRGRRRTFSRTVQWHEARTPDWGVVARSWMCWVSKGECWGTNEQQPQICKHVSILLIM